MGEARYSYRGHEARFYPQYIDTTGGGWRPLEAEPGGAYAIEPAAGYPDGKGGSLLPVPPADGRWAQVNQPRTLPAKATDQAATEGEAA